MSGVRPNTPRLVKMIEVVMVESLRGFGQQGDPVRVVTQYWSLDGELLAENDPVRPVTETEEPAPRRS